MRFLAAAKTLSGPMRSSVTTTTTTTFSRLHSTTSVTVSRFRRPRFRTASHQHQSKQTSRRIKATVASDAMESSTTSPMERIRVAVNEILQKPRAVPIPRWVSPQHQTVTLSECFGHSSFVLVAISYAVDDFLMLRMIAVAGSTAMLVFTYFHPHGRVLWLPFKWNLLFIAINSYRIGKVFLDRYFAEQLNHEMLRLHDVHLYVMDRCDFAKLVRMGRVETYRPNEMVIQQGEPNGTVRLVLEGNLHVMRDGRLTYLLEEGNFISEGGLHAGLLLPGKLEACCTIVADSKVRMISWNRDQLVGLLRNDKQIRRALKAALTWDIVRKLKAQRFMVTSGLIHDAEEWTERRNVQNYHRYAAILQRLLAKPAYLNKTRHELAKYRMIHHIDDEYHRLALQECGWTIDEFEAGVKKRRTGHDGFGEVQVLAQYAENFLARVFG